VVSDLMLLEFYYRGWSISSKNIKFHKGFYSLVQTPPQNSKFSFLFFLAPVLRYVTPCRTKT
jgi:hypothetical protein